MQEFALQLLLQALAAIDTVQELVLLVVLPRFCQRDCGLCLLDLFKLLDALLDLLIVVVFSCFQVLDFLGVVDDLLGLVVALLFQPEAVEGTIEVLQLLRWDHTVDAHF